MFMKVDSNKDIEELLKSGWIFCMVQKNDEAYFNDSFFRHIPDEEKFRYGHGWFHKKSETLFRRFVNIGMSKNSDAYDSCILMIMGKIDKSITVNLLSLKEGSSIEKVANGILADKEKNT